MARNQRHRAGVRSKRVIVDADSFNDALTHFLRTNDPTWTDHYTPPTFGRGRHPSTHQSDHSHHLEGEFSGPIPLPPA